jgi:hypothetical protein
VPVTITCLVAALLVQYASPVFEVVYGGRSYVIPSSTDIAKLVVAHSASAVTR